MLPAPVPEADQAEPRTPRASAELEYLECDIEDYSVAYAIMSGGVMTSTYAEIPRAMAAFYEELRELFRARARQTGLKTVEVGLTQREIRKGVGWIGGESAKKYLRRLVSLEYLQLSHGGERGMRNSYQLVADEPLERLDFSMIPSPEAIEASAAEQSRVLPAERGSTDCASSTWSKVGKEGKSGYSPLSQDQVIAL